MNPISEKQMKGIRTTSKELMEFNRKIEERRALWDEYKDMDNDKCYVFRNRYHDYMCVMIESISEADARESLCQDEHDNYDDHHTWILESVTEIKELK